jgi:putative tRNA adenosine deaminase-associated protein
VSQYFAALVARRGTKWSGSELDVEEHEDLDAVVDAIRDEADGELALLFVEQGDEYFLVVRVDSDGDARTFISDVRAIDMFPLAAMIMEDEVPVIRPDDDDDEDSVRPESQPAGDGKILADLGLSEEQLLELCGEEGMLPADVITAACEKAGCADVLEEIRETG